MSLIAPTVSVILPVFNAEIYLQEAIESILNQTYRDFEFIIICDGSTIKTRSIIDCYLKLDERLHVIYREKGTLVSALNQGISIAKGKYIARMDADDISFPSRLKIQVDFMEAHPDIGVCGTWLISEGRERAKREYPVENNWIKSELFFSCPIPHPTVIMRRSILSYPEVRYNEWYECAEDFGLWVDCMDITQFSNIDKILLKYRVHVDAVSKKNRDKQEDTVNKIRLLLVKKLKIEPTPKEFEIHRRICDKRFSTNPEVLSSVQTWLTKILSKNKEEKIFPEQEFAATIAQKWYEWCVNSTPNGKSAWEQFWESPLSGYIELRTIQKVKFFIACLLKIRQASS